jgi:LuxR family maltose regulon positive regulatory protein
MAGKGDPISIMQTKLYRPPVTADYVQRPRLLERLEQGKKLPLTLIAAPAGYGKTTLISHWIESAGIRAAWISLEPSDSDLRIFLSYLVAAVRSAAPNSCRQTGTLLQAARLPSTEKIATALNNDLNKLTKPLTLVLDDYHAITQPDIHDLLDFQLKHPLKNLQLIILSRRTPALSTAALRARNCLCEIRLGDMVFSQTETEQFLINAARHGFSPETAAMLHDAMDGWPAGLRLLLVAVGEKPDRKRILESLSGESATIQDYLISEILSDLSPQRLRCICRLSLLSRFCLPLCHALCGSQCGQSDCMHRVDELKGNQETWAPLCIPLDSHSYWFRFHHLFRKTLQHRLKQICTPEEITEIHRRAMNWLEENGEIEEALYHAGQISDEETVCLILRHRNEAMNSERWIDLRRWLDLLPENLVQDSPELLLLAAWCTVGSPEMFEPIERAAKLIKSRPPKQTSDNLRGELLAAEALRYYAQRDAAQTIQTASRALKLLDSSQLSERGFAMLMLQFGRQMSGDFDEGRSEILQQLSSRAILQTTCHGRLLASLCFTYWMEADPVQMIDFAEEYSRLGSKNNLDEARELSHYFRGVCHYAANHIEEASKHLQQVVDSPTVIHQRNYLHSLYALAMVRQAQGKGAEARKLVKDAVAYSLQSHCPSLLELSMSFEAEIALRQGNISKAARWQERFDPDSDPILWRFYVPHFTQIRTLLALGTPEAAKKAARLSSSICALTRESNNRCFEITSLTLHALAQEQIGKTDAALRDITRAVELAQPGGTVRSLIDEGPAIVPLLSRLSLDREALQFIGQIITAFKPADTVQADTAGMSHVGELLDPLSGREHEVLREMASGLSNREIGEKLYISAGTVKRHTNSIYAKLGTHSRREAVAKAAGLGLIGG